MPPQRILALNKLFHLFGSNHDSQFLSLEHKSKKNCDKC
jgi:hypothetical protein